MKLTTNYSLKKPEGSDVVNIDDFNYNADTIDTKLKAIETQSNTNKTNISTLQNEVSANKTSIQAANTKIIDNTTLANQALNKANEAFQRGDNVKTQLVDKLISEGLNVSTDNTFEELISGIALGKKWATGVAKESSSYIKFTREDSYTTLSRQYIEIKLDFEASSIIALSKSANNTLDTFVIYNTQKCTFTDKPYVLSISYNSGASGIAFVADDNIIKGDNLYRLPLQVTYNQDWKFIAYE